MHIELKNEPFDPWQSLSGYQPGHGSTAKIGACSAFVGSMRDFNEGQTIEAMTLDYYPGMTERQLDKIVRRQLEVHQLVDVLVIHRVGQIQPGEPIVLVAVWSSHRKQAFDACRDIMEELKHHAPFWKQEQTEQGTHWVGKNTPG